MSWARRTDEVVRITTAAASPQDDIDHRQKRYIIVMTIRTLGFIAAAISLIAGVAWVAAVLLVATLVLPTVAVVMANRASPILPGSPFESPSPRGELGDGAKREIQ